MENKESKQKKDSIKLEFSIWQIVSFVVIVLLVLSIVFNIVQAVKTDSSVGLNDTNAVDLADAEITVSALVSQMVTPDANVALESSAEISGLYSFQYTINGQNVALYTSKDVKLICLQGILYDDLKKEIAVANNQTDTTKKPEAYTLPDLTIAPTLGNVDSKVTVLEFSDFQCPFCGLAYGAPWSEQYQSDAKYSVMWGVVKKIEALAQEGTIAFKHYPVAFLDSQNPVKESHIASNAALCGLDQNKYWDVHNAIFDAQTQEENNNKYTVDKIKLLVDGIEGLDVNMFNNCVDSELHMQEVDDMTNSVMAASYANTNTFGTPAFYIVVDPSVGADKINAAVSESGYSVLPTSDKSKYVIIADSNYDTLKTVIDALTS